MMPPVYVALLSEHNGKYFNEKKTTRFLITCVSHLL